MKPQLLAEPFLPCEPESEPKVDPEPRRIVYPGSSCRLLCNKR